ncbi:MAG TPA: DUF5916 domain-containing protein [Flavisolibacter sp.]|nr:DUF5916 domain-containing protein [Flavisolibacter sp.]
MLRGLFLFGTLCWVHALLAQKTLTAIKSQASPVIDCKLDDAIWQAAPVATNFIQTFPSFGIPASTKTDVRILYNDNAVYIGAYLHDDPALIRRQLTARDGEQRQDVDYFSVFFDTYNDQQNGFQFLVTTANVQSDTKLNANASYGFGEFGDRTWDAVWQSRVKMVADGWIVEMRIPYISLRFAKKDVQTWGLQFLRFSRRNNESSYWNPVNPNENGYIQQFGKYTPLENIHPPLRLSFSPYLTGGIRYNPAGSTTDREWLRNGGMDVKYGINESFTLDATLIPDFGQVISDNLVNNLSPFEIRFQENRPFFTEGTELFNKAGLFYSRRIGTIPGGYYDVQNLEGAEYSIEKNPSVTQLYNAIKFSGRTKNKLGIGVFNAVTAPMRATLQNNFTKRDTLVETEPLTNYNIIVLDQALSGRSSITFTNSSVIRNGNSRDANVSAFDWSFFSKDNNYRFRGTTRYSKIFGFTPYTGNINLVDDTVRMNGRLYVHPYDGFNTTLQFGKVSGKVQYNLSANIESNDYDPNDLGYNQAPNDVAYTANISYNQLTATDKFINYNYSLNARYGSMYKPFAYNQMEIWGSAFWWFKNFWDVRVNLGTQPYDQHDYFELRTPARYVLKQAFHYVSLNGSTDSRKKLYVSFNGGYARTEIENGTYIEVGGGVRYRFSDQLTLSLDMSRQDDQTQVGYAFLREANGEPIIGYRRNLGVTTIVSGIYNFTSRLNLTMRTRHYWNQVAYRDFFNVAADGSHIKRAFIAGQDENYNLFNVDAFLTWDFRLGSRIIVGYKNWIGNPYGVMGQTNYLQNLKGIFSTSHGNELTVKLIYFLDYNQLRKKR